jgi:probable DNA metabolism protein
MHLVYDGTFEGFLTLVYDVYYEKLSPTKVTKEHIQVELVFEDIVEIYTNKEKYTKVFTALKSKFNKFYYEKIFNTFMCDTKNFELDLLNYIILGFKDQKQLENINYSFINNMAKYEHELFRHVHKMYAYARFKELDDGSLYAQTQSKFNVVYFLGRHFKKRFNNQNFIIHDLDRQIAYIHTKEFKGIQNVASFEQPTYSKNEEKFDKLWKSFFKAVSIKERENLKLQQNHVPLLYRNMMNEFN